MAKTFAGLFAVVILLWSAPATRAAVQFSQQLTSNVIYGTGNQDGGFTTDRNVAQGVELGLRAHQRLPTTSDNAAGIKDQGNGDYGSFVAAGWGAGNNRASWNFDWSINTNYSGTTGAVISSLTYLIEIDYDPGYGTSFLSFDPMVAVPGSAFPDHSFGNNSTPNNGSAAEATSAANFTTLKNSNNVAQNSWQLNFFEFPVSPFLHDPTANGVYDVRLSAFDGGGLQVAQTGVQVIVGTGAPEPTAFLMWGGLIMCVSLLSVRAMRFA
jgi:hypothetical protein